MSNQPNRPEVRARIMRANEEHEDATPIDRISALIHTGSDDQRHFYLALTENTHPEGGELWILNLRYFALAKPESNMRDTFLRNGIAMRDRKESDALPAALSEAFGKAAQARPWGKRDPVNTLFTSVE